MISIIIAFSKIEDAKNIKNILVVPQNIKKVNIRTLKVKKCL